MTIDELIEEQILELTPKLSERGVWREKYDQWVVLRDTRRGNSWNHLARELVTELINHFKIKGKCLNWSFASGIHGEIEVLQKMLQDL